MLYRPTLLLPKYFFGLIPIQRARIFPNFGRRRAARAVAAGCWQQQKLRQTLRRRNVCSSICFGKIFFSLFFTFFRSAVVYLFRRAQRNLNSAKVEKDPEKNLNGEPWHAGLGLLKAENCQK